MHAEMSIVFHIRSRANRQLIRCWFFKCFSFDLYFDVEHQKWPPHHGRRNASRQFIFAENAASLELWTWIKSITRILIFFLGTFHALPTCLLPLSLPLALAGFKFNSLMHTAACARTLIQVTFPVLRFPFSESINVTNVRYLVSRYYNNTVAVLVLAYTANGICRLHGSQYNFLSVTMQ